MKKIFIGFFLIILAIIVIFATVDFKQLREGNTEPVIAEMCSKPHNVDPKIKLAADTVYSKFIEIGFTWNRDIRNCINMEFSDDRTKYASFSTNGGNPTIFVNSSLKDEKPVVLSTLLAHEMVHAAQYFNNELDLKYPKCVDNEVDAFMYQLYFIYTLPQDQQLEIYTAPEELSNQFKSMVSTVGPIIDSCRNNDECINKNVKGKVREVVMANPAYQKQCDF